MTDLAGSYDTDRDYGPFFFFVQLVRSASNQNNGRHDASHILGWYRGLTAGTLGRIVVKLPKLK
jgi:hypothetical protein